MGELHKRARASTMRLIFYLPLRKTKGFLSAIFHLASLDLPVPGGGIRANTMHLGEATGNVDQRRRSLD